MSILTRHLIRAHLGPFFFALSALTGLLFLNAVTQRMEDLAGKGLGAEVLVDFLLLSLPHTIALTMPMAVLVAVLYAFSEMAAANEITAMKAGGIPPRRILLPMLGMGVIAAAIMFYFNDQVLPEANHRLKNLLYDISRKSPTFLLSEQAWTRLDVEGEGNRRYQLMAETVDNRTSSMTEILIVDRNDPQLPRWIEAERGEMAFNEARTDLYLTLYDGVNLESDRNQPGAFRKTFFERQLIPLRGIGNEFERQQASDRREREMTVDMLQEGIAEREVQIAEFRERNRTRTVNAVKAVLGLPYADPSVEELDRQTRQRVQSGAPTPRPSMNDEVTRGAQLMARTLGDQVRAARTQVNAYEVEIHKKYSLAFACIVFVLLGGPLAVRFPRGGLGLVIAASTAIFAVYWVGLLTGEDLGDAGIAPAWLTMWVPNLVFGLLGIWLFRGMGRETSTMRGGGIEDLFWTARQWGAKLIPGRRRAGEAN